MIEMLRPPTREKPNILAIALKEHSKIPLMIQPEQNPIDSKYIILPQGKYREVN